MLNSPINDIMVENARFIRDVEYVKETSFDDVIDKRLEVAESEYTRETASELQEALEMVNQLPPEEDPVVESAEIDRILNATENITFEEMANI